MCAMCFKTTLKHGYCSRENQSLKKTAEIIPLSVYLKHRRDIIRGEYRQQYNNLSLATRSEYRQPLSSQFRELHLATADGTEG